MNGVEAAASLFGSDDSSSDPFASLGDSAIPSTFSDYTAHVPQAEEQLLPGQSSVPNETQLMTPGENTSRHYPAMQQGSFQGYDHLSPYGSSSAVGQQQTSNWYGADGHTNVSTQQDQNHTANANYWSAYSTSPEPPRTTVPSQNTYDPYTPPIMNGTYTNAYTASTSASDYSPYKATVVPPTKSPVSHHSSSYTPVTSTTHTASTPPSNKMNVSSLTASFPLPPAPVPATIITRPKISNAYDPPFPPTTKSKRVLSRGGPSQNITTGYGPYQGGNGHNSQTTTYDHQQPHPVPVLKSEAQSFGNMMQQEYGDYSNEPVFSVREMGRQNSPSHGHPTADNNQEQNASFYSSTWNIPPNHVNGYHSQGNEGQSNGMHAFTDSMEGGNQHYFMDSSPLPAVGVEGHNNEFSPGMSSHPEIDLENVTVEGRFRTSVNAHISSDLGDIARSSSPETIINHQPLVPSSVHVQLPSKVEPVINENDATNTISVHNGLRSPKPPASTVSLSGVSQTYTLTSSDPYGPPKGNRYAIEERRAVSPGCQSIRSLNGRQSTKSHPVGRPPSRIENLRGRSASNGAALGSTYHENLYAPQLHQKSQVPISEAGITPRVPPHVSPLSYPTYEPPAVPEMPVKFQSHYTPSPSLLGSNDPLGRTSTRAPVVHFGFGGKLVTCFHGLNAGFDAALSSRRTTHVQIHNLMKVVPRSVLDIPGTSFPGPLFSDPVTTTSSLVRTGATSQKNKKAVIIKYLTERADEVSHGLGYLNPDSTERRRAEGKLILIKLLRIMVENDGRLSGSASIDAGVRTVLVPRLDGTLASPTSEFTTTADAHVIRPDAGSMVDPDSVIAVSTLRSSCLDKIQEFLLRGERRQAYHYALDEKLWAHAMIIASSIDKEAWKEVINEFLKAELCVKDENIHGHLYSKSKDPSVLSTNGREALRMTYSLFSGQGSASIQELVSQNILGRGTTKFQVQNVIHAHVTPRTPNFQPPAPPANIPSETLTKWAEIVAMMVSSTISPDTSSALTALGDQLLANQYIEAAHACYLLAPQTSLMGGLGNPAVRIILVGSKNPALVPNFTIDPDPIVFSEIVEFALSLSPTAKSQEPFAGLPHLQAYRFIRAISLAEVGEIPLANRYCESITASLGRPSPYFTPVLLEQLKGLIDRISGTSHVDKSNSWMGSKIGKPSLDSIGGWLEGRFTKLVTGDADPPTQAQDVEERTFSGPFSTISSAAPSARSSPQPTSINMTPVPPLRSGSAMASPTHPSYASIDRSSSALDYRKPKAISAPRVASAGAAVTAFSQPPVPGPPPNNQSQDMANSSVDLTTPKTANGGNADDQEPIWWGNSEPYNYNDNPSARTPTATSFMRVDESTVKTTQEGFISLMDAPTFSPITSSTTRDSLNQRPVSEEDIEDLGFGNTRKDSKMIAVSGVNTHESPQHTEVQKPAEPGKTEPNPPTSSGGSWISRWWKRESPPGPVKASLGEESSFYYDKELQRWVNKKTGSEDIASKSAPPPPPSRAQTASPGMTGPRFTASKPANAQTYSTSAIDLSTSPPSKPTLRVRSNLAPPGSDSAPSSPTATRTGAGGPPPGRPKSQTSTRRNLRSRYIDVLQSEGGGS
ncbi:hypothetical protein AX15_003926 [Amanita polypyramis BW_CC]|nr:hypothetical protein AX15_003926 [Amanita polypyramis BW_CC]